MITKLIVGLGNPGKEYEHTPHNLGFAAIEALATELGAEPWANNTKFLCQSTNYKDTLLVKPQTFMNLSGDCVGKLAQFYKIEPEDIFILHDDVSLPIGTLKISTDKGPANHNGVISIIDALHSTTMPRFRLGIQKSTQLSLKDYVLSPITHNDIPLVTTMIITTINAVRTALDANIASAMTHFN